MKFSWQYDMAKRSELENGCIPTHGSGDLKFLTF